MKTAGLAPMTVQEGDATGVVNVLNGSLTLSYPIGPSFPVNEALSYQLQLSYSSANRRWVTGDDPTEGPTDFIRGRSPVGLGWTMHFGRIASDPDGPNAEMAYQSAAGV